MIARTLSRGERLRRLGNQLLNLAEEIDEPSRSIMRSERLTEDGERIASAVREVFRGRA